MHAAKFSESVVHKLLGWASRRAYHSAGFPNLKTRCHWIPSRFFQP